MGTTNSSEKPQRRVKHGQRPTEPLADWPVEFGADGAGQPAATSGDAPADLTMYQAQSEFSDYFSKNYPMDTIIADPDWHSTKIWQAAMSILGRVERIEPATASGDEPLTVNGILVERADVGPACRYLTEHTILDGQALQAAWEKLVAFYVANRAVSAATKPTADAESAWKQYIGQRTQLMDTSSNRAIFAAGYSAAATKPTADLSKQLEEIAQSWNGCRYDDAMIDDIGEALRRDFAKLSLLATKPAAAPAVPEGWALYKRELLGAAFDLTSKLTALPSLGIAQYQDLIPREAVMELTVKWRARVDAANREFGLLAATPAASTTGAAQTAEQVRKGEQA